MQSARINQARGIGKSRAGGVALVGNSEEARQRDPESKREIGFCLNQKPQRVGALSKYEP